MTNEAQVAVAVTGASTGIGKTIALALDAHGFRVFAGVRKEADGLALSREARHGLTPVLLDVTNETAIGRAIETVTAQTQGQLHGLVNNAGVGLGGPLELVPISKTRELFEVNSSVGITRQKEGLTFRDVDYQGNKNLLEVALRAGVRKFVYVSTVNGPRLRHLDIVDAHEAFVEELEASGIDYTVVRPTGYFSDMSEVLEMARRGKVWLIGPGTNRVNPIHGADLAVVCADAIESRESEIAAGGPHTTTWREAAKLAFEVLGRPEKVTCIPAWLMWPVVRLVRLFNRHQGELLAFFTTMATTDVVAPPTGTRTLERYFKSGAPSSVG